MHSPAEAEVWRQTLCLARPGLDSVLGLLPREGEEHDPGL